MLALPQRILTRVLLSFAVVSYMSVILGFVISNHSIAEDAPMNRQQQCEEYAVYQDATGNWLDCENTQAEESYKEESYKEDVYIEDTYVEEPYQEEVYQEETYQEETYQEETYTD
jgi:hypothetical protein